MKFEDMMLKFIAEQVSHLPSTVQDRVKVRTDRMRELVTMDGEGMIAFVIIVAEHRAGLLEENSDSNFIRLAKDCLEEWTDDG